MSATEERTSKVARDEAVEIVLLVLLDDLRRATSIGDVNCAAGAAREELLALTWTEVLEENV